MGMLELAAPLRSKYMWRRMELFEMDNYFTFAPRRYTQFMQSTRPLADEIAVLAKLYAMRSVIWVLGAGCVLVLFVSPALSLSCIRPPCVVDVCVALVALLKSRQHAVSKRRPSQHSSSARQWYSLLPFDSGLRM